ncbi:hypothetical protein LEP48_01750 [Isoptericola sp. NEAU-Y5]|uniref:Uncharacterized protein n=1 Tax=Isoptericola luteus TaxID=2879484 RepID=A0ABS7ZAJ0_9MICO|nr:hypothetical protein [Isoptericola sp. NEAU-Y5]MCA5892075.1 hypothetical protein [Isoptericola sp. NEAU-Y5]
MRRVLVVGVVVATIDGALLGAAAALGWTVLAGFALVAGLAAAVTLALTVPPPRETARPSTVTLGLPVRDADAVEPEIESELPPVPIETLRPSAEPTPAAA